MVNPEEKIVGTVEIYFYGSCVNYYYYCYYYSMEQSPSAEANQFLASQKILQILWNP